MAPMPPLAAKTQVVTGGGEFNTAELAAFVAASKLDNAGLDYQIVAITGPQSSGKSTLLNYVVRRSNSWVEWTTGSLAHRAHSTLTCMRIPK